MIDILLSLFIPFIGTVLGAGTVFLVKGELKKSVLKSFSGFAAGVMIAASVWSLLIPAMDMSVHMGKLSFVPALVGLLLGICFLFILDKIIPHLHFSQENPEGFPVPISRTLMLVFAVTLHNIPEGMAIGVVYSGLLQNGVSYAEAIALSIGIAIQNFPEGAIISMPLRIEGNGRLKSFFYGAFSGIVEPIFAVITILITSFISGLLPYLLSFAAGAMIYVVVEELIPNAVKDGDGDVCTIGFAIGFAIMMVLDVALG